MRILVQSEVQSKGPFVTVLKTGEILPNGRYLLALAMCDCKRRIVCLREMAVCRVYDKCPRCLGYDGIDTFTKVIHPSLVSTEDWMLHWRPWHGHVLACMSVYLWIRDYGVENLKGIKCLQLLSAR